MGESRFASFGMQIQRSPFLAILFAVIVGCSGDSGSQPDDTAPVDTVDAALRDARVEDAQQIVNNALLQSPDDPNLLTDAARVSVAAGDLAEAANLLVEAAKAADFSPTSRVELAMRALLDLGDVYAAIDLLSQAVESQPNNHALRRLLFGLLGEAGRSDLMQEHFEAIIRNRKFDVLVLVAYTDTSERLFSGEMIEQWMKRNPSDHRLRLGKAQSLRGIRRYADAEKVLREIIQHHPGFAPAHALLGRMPSVQNSSAKDFDTWLAAALPHCRNQANFWVALGDRHFCSEDYAAAISCHLAAVRISPNMVIPWTQIGRSIRQMRLASNQDTEVSGTVAERLSVECDQRSRMLLDLRMHLQRFGGSAETSQRTAGDVARALNKMGRHWEAEAWAAVATVLPNQKDPGIDALRREIIADLKQNQQWSSIPNLSPLDTFTRQARINFTEIAPASAVVVGPTSADSASELHLADETKMRRLDVPTVQYRDLALSLIDTLGAGGGTLDFDLDGWSDLILAATGGEPRKANDRPNTLLRNSNGKFRNVSAHTNSGTGFGQGIAIGDYNEDGFPDIFVAKVGINQLLRNNGDGTFSDDTQSLGTEAYQWTSCGAFVDMDGDSVTDLVVVNYCDLNLAVDEPCQTASGPAPCHPAKFRADNDQLLLGNGSGGFQQQLDDDIRQITPGRGLGILAGNLTGDFSSAFVANDMSSNHLFRFANDDLTESATLRGLAVDAQSFTQASMGIAHGDFDGDLDLDLYVTGFANEYNIYYEQQASGFWVDKTSRQGLIKMTQMTVGFGTQAIDLDADGVDELTITNGHIGDFGPDQPPPAQPFQLLRRTGNGVFKLAEMTRQSPYLSTNHIGRALWKIDVDRDLADDLVVSHQNAPPTLLANRTETDNRRIAVQCVGTTSSRDAIGAIIKFVVGGRQRAMWLLSGDGYMSSNERILKAGIGSNDRAEDVTVTWPSGRVESFGTIGAGQTCLLIEGTSEAFVCN